jgi:hypothetical protein
MNGGGSWEVTAFMGHVLEKKELSFDRANRRLIFMHKIN